MALQALLLVLAGALALLLTLTVRTSSGRLAGISGGLSAQRDRASAVIAVFLLIVVVTLCVVRAAGQT